MRPESSFLFRTSPAMAKVAPSLLAVGSGASFTALPSPRKGASFFRDRVVSRRARISAKLGMIPQSSLALLFLFEAL
uniref:Uncharacterized protein n=1 Tax=Setaria italica TaxID=4555 RepID=K4AHI6_SETIT